MTSLLEELYCLQPEQMKWLPQISGFMFQLCVDAVQNSKLQIHSKRWLCQQTLWSLLSFFPNLTGTKQTPVVMEEGIWHFLILDEGFYRQSVFRTTLCSFFSWVGMFQKHLGGWGVRHLRDI